MPRRQLPRAVKDVLGGAESLPEEALMRRMERAGLPAFFTQVELVPNRKFRYDFAFGPEYKVAIELQGGVYSGGRHTRGKGYEKDAEKSALAQALGYIVLYVTPSQVQSGQAVEWITAALKSRGWTGT